MLQVFSGARRQFLQLLDQHRREIDHGARFRIGFQVRGHIDVVLDRVQISPRQVVLARQCIAVVWLMHMPQQHHRKSFNKISLYQS